MLPYYEDDDNNSTAQKGYELIYQKCGDDTDHGGVRLDTRCVPASQEKIPDKPWLAHFPEGCLCDVRREALMQRKRDKRKPEKDKDPFTEPRGFGDIIALDNVSVIQEQHAPRHGG